MSSSPIGYDLNQPTDAMIMRLLEFNCIEYAESLKLQHAIVEQKLLHGGPDVVMVLEHPPTVTLGIRSGKSDLVLPKAELAAMGVSVHESDRGGAATYHGPGQIVVYPIVDMRGLGMSVREYVHALEETVLRTLQRFGLKGFRQKGKVGIWTGTHEKISSIGVRIRRRIAFHGFSLNVDLKDDPSRLVICCGMPATRHVSMNELLSDRVEPSAVRIALMEYFCDVFRVTLERAEPWNTPESEADSMSRHLAVMSTKEEKRCAGTRPHEPQDPF